MYSVFLNKSFNISFKIFISYIKVRNYVNPTNYTTPVFDFIQWLEKKVRYIHHQKKCLLSTGLNV